MKVYEWTEGLDYSITHLNLSSCNLTSLEGIEKFKNLKRLSVYENMLISLEGIEHLKHLESLFCSYNRIEDINPLKGLKSLEALYCYSNNITSLKDIESLLSLKELGCDSNILKIENLLNLTNIQTINYNLIDYKTIKYLYNIKTLFLNHQ